MNEELKPYPFCGSSANIWEPSNMKFGEWEITCNGEWCGASMEGYSGTKESAIELWNRRA